MAKLRKKLCMALVIFLLPAFLFGCIGDSKDIHHKSILTAIAVDKKGDEFLIYAEIANVESSGGSQNKGGTGKKYIHVISRGKTIPEARENLDRQLDKAVYPSAIRVLILTENFAKEYLAEYLNRVRADEAYRKKTITVITRENPENLFETCNKKDISVGFYVEDTLKSLEEDGGTFTRTTTRLLENLSTEYTGILMPCVGLQDQDIALKGYSVVNGATIDGFIPVEESKALVFLKADRAIFNYVVYYKQNKYTIELTLKKRKIKPIYENGNIHYDMTFGFEAKMKYGDQKTPYRFTDADNADVERILKRMLTAEFIDAIDLAQKYFKCDYLQFDDYFRLKYPSEFEKMDWQTEFEKATYSVEANVELSGTWMMDYETGEQK